MATFVGPRNDNFELVDDIDVTPSLEILDDIGAKRANVYLLTQRKGFQDQWEQLLPTPHIQYFGVQQELDQGGIGVQTQVKLKNIPVSLYSESYLETDTENDDVDRYWILAGPGLEPRAYTTERIEKQNPLLWDMTLKVFDSINSEDIIIPGEEDMGLSQPQVDDRIVALVAKGALKTASDNEKSNFLFSKTFPLTLPSEGSYMVFNRSNDGLVLSHTIMALTSPVGAVPNVVGPENNGGPWGIQFVDAEFSVDALHQIIPPISTSMNFERNDQLYAADGQRIKGNTTANFEYTKRSASQSDPNRGRWTITWGIRSQASGLSKPIKALRVQFGSADPIDYPLSRDPNVANAYALRSEELGTDPVPLQGTGSVPVTFNFVFNDDTLAYGEQGEEYTEDPREADLKYVWETWAGPDEQNLNNVVNTERFHHDFETSDGFDIDLKTFDFTTSLTGSSMVSSNARRDSSVNQIRIRLDLTRHDGQQWPAGTYRLKLHRGNLQPYIHDFQFKKGLSQ